MNIDKICELAKDLIRVNKEIKYLRFLLDDHLDAEGSYRSFICASIFVTKKERDSIYNHIIDLKSKNLASIIVEFGNEINKEEMGG